MEPLTFADIFVLLDRWEKRLVGMGVHDNCRCMCLWLKLWGDGSGSVMAQYSKVNPDDDENLKMVRTVMTMEPHRILDFDTMSQLHGDLVSRTMHVGP